MDLKGIYEQYDESSDLLKFLTSSNVRTSILLSLNESSKNLTGLKQDLNLESSTVIHSTNKLEKRNLIFKNGENYSLSQTGKIFAIKLVNLIKTIDTVKSHEKLWLNHEIDEIPDDLLLKIGDLNDSNLIESVPKNIDHVHSTFVQLLLNAKLIQGVTPIFHPDFPELLQHLVVNGVDIQLIITKEVLDVWIDALGHEILDGLLSQKNFSLWTIEDSKTAFTVTDSMISLGFFRTDGSYDYSHDLISDDKNAVQWGTNLFKRYFKMAKRFK